MATLLLRLAAPLQAWGADSKFETRKTGRERSLYDSRKELCFIVYS